MKPTQEQDDEKGKPMTYWGGLAQPEPEAVAYDINGATVYIKPPVYTAPPQREWQGLTDEEIDQAAWPHFIGNILPSVKIIVRQLEAKLKEKNHG